MCLCRITPRGEVEDGEYGFIGMFTLCTAGIADGETVCDYGVPKKH